MTNPEMMVFCPVLDQEISIDLCREKRMTGDNEFIPDIIEDALAPTRIRQCELCANRSL